MTERAFRVRILAAADRELRKLPPDAAARVRRPMIALARDPWPTGSALVAGTRFRRLRVGDLRVVYDIRVEEGEIFILRVARRSEATYRRIR